MTLKSIVRITAETKYEVIARFQKDEHYEFVKVDYLSDPSVLSDCLQRRFALEKRKNRVLHVSVNSVTHLLEITVEILD